MLEAGVQFLTVAPGVIDLRSSDTHTQHRGHTSNLQNLANLVGFDITFFKLYNHRGYRLHE